MYLPVDENCMEETDVPEPDSLFPRSSGLVFMNSVFETTLQTASTASN